MNRSNAREPVCCAQRAVAADRGRNRRHSAPVLESIQIGDTDRDSMGVDLIRKRRAWPRVRKRRRGGGRLEIDAAVLLRGSGHRREPSDLQAAAATRAIMTSSAAVHINGEDTAIAGSAAGRTPWLVPYLGRVSSNNRESSNTTRR